MIRYSVVVVVKPIVQKSAADCMCRRSNSDSARQFDELSTGFFCIAISRVQRDDSSWVLTITARGESGALSGMKHRAGRRSHVGPTRHLVLQIFGGAIGGGVGGQIMGALIPMLANTTAMPDISVIITQVIGGGVSGAILIAIVGALKSRMA